MRSFFSSDIVNAEISLFFIASYLHPSKLLAMIISETNSKVSGSKLHNMWSNFVSPRVIRLTLKTASTCTNHYLGFCFQNGGILTMAADEMCCDRTWSAWVCRLLLSCEAMLVSAPSPALPPDALCWNDIVFKVRGHQYRGLNENLYFTKLIKSYWILFEFFKRTKASKKISDKTEKIFEN